MANNILNYTDVDLDNLTDFGYSIVEMKAEIAEARKEREELRDYLRQFHENNMTTRDEPLIYPDAEYIADMKRLLG
jgi:hypothetical protein